MIDFKMVESLKEVGKLRGDYQFFQNLVKMFYESSTSSLEKLSYYLTTVDSTEAQRECHKWKGSCYTIGAEELAKSLEKIEGLLKSYNASKAPVNDLNVPALLSTLHEQFEQTYKILEKISIDKFESVD